MFKGQRDKVTTKIGGKILGDTEIRRGLQTPKSEHTPTM